MSVTDPKRMRNSLGSDDDPHYVGPLLERSPTIGRGHGMGGTCGTWAPSANPPHTHTRIPSPSVISKFHSRVCFDRAQLLAICKPPISSTTNQTATEVRRSTDGWRIFSIKSRLSAPSPPGAQLATHLPNRSTSVVSLAAELSVRGALSSIDLEISGDLGEFRVKFRNVSYRFECAAVPP